MKKIISLVFAAIMALSAVCFAAGDGAVLNKDQKLAETMIGMFDDTATYPMVIKGFNEEAKKSFTEEIFKQVKQQAKEKYGKMKETKFVAFQRMDQVDIVAYLGSFSKEKIVNLAFIFDKEGKMVNFQFTPVQPQEEAKPEAKK